MRNINTLNNIIYYSLLFLIIYFIYKNLISFNYVLNDDWSYFSYEHIGLLEGHPQKNFFLLTGRGGYLLFATFNEWYVAKVEDLKVIRFISLLIIFINSIYIFEDINNKFIKTFFILLFVSLPFNIVNVEWITMYPFVIVSFLSILAAKIVYSNHESGYSIFISLILLLLCFFTYQPYAFFFILYIYNKITLNNELDYNKIKISLIVFVFSMVFYFILHKFVILPFLLNYQHFIDTYKQLDNYKFDLNYDPLRSIIFLINNDFSFLNAWQKIFPDNYFNLFILSLSLFLCIKIDKKYILKISLFFVITSIIVMAPYILSKTPHPSFRVLAVQHALSLCFFLQILHRIYEHDSSNIIFKIILFFYSLYNIFIITNYININADYYAVEYKFLKDKIEHLDYNKNICITPLNTNINETYNGLKQMGEGEFFHNTFIDLNNTVIAINYFKKYYLLSFTQDINDIIYQNNNIKKNLVIFSESCITNNNYYSIDMNELVTN